MGFVALWHVGFSRTRARTRVPCIGRWILNHCATREVPPEQILKAVLRTSHCMYGESWPLSVSPSPDIPNIPSSGTASGLLITLDAVVGGIPGNDGCFFAIVCIFPPLISCFSPQGGSGGKKNYQLSKKVRVCFEGAAGEPESPKRRKKRIQANV